MSERLTNILGYLTLVAVLAAVWVMFGEDPTRDQGARGERTFVGLEERINEVHKVSIRGNGQTATIIKNGTDWQMNERDAYKVDPDKVRQMLRGIAFSNRREPKTADKTRFELLGLGREATEIELSDDTGGVLLSFQMGKRSATSDGRSLTYTYQSHDTRSWLVTALAETVADPGWWLKRPLLAIDERRVSDVIIGGAWLTRKLSDSNFRVQGARAGEKSVDYWLLSDPARVIAGMTFDDVRKLSNPLAEAQSKIELTTYDGLKLNVALYGLDGGLWAMITAEFDPALQGEGKGGELVGAPADGEAEVEQIMKAARGWIFKLNDSDAAVLQRVRADFLATNAN